MLNNLLHKYADTIICAIILDVTTYFTLVPEMFNTVNEYTILPYSLGVAAVVVYIKNNIQYLCHMVSCKIAHLTVKSACKYVLTQTASYCGFYCICQVAHALCM